MQPARVAARTGRGVVQLHREAWPITAYYWLYTQYAPRVLHFSAFHSNSIGFSSLCRVSIHITSGPLLGYVAFCQITIAQINYRYSFIYDYLQHHVSFSLKVLLDLSMTVSHFWSLQFLKAIIPPFCISEKLTGIHVNMLNLVPAIYP